MLEAIRADDPAAVRSLIEAGTDVNAGDDAGNTPLMEAALYVLNEGKDTLHFWCK